MDVLFIHPTGRICSVFVIANRVCVRFYARGIGGVFIRFAVIFRQVVLRLVGGQGGVLGDLGAALIPAGDVIAHDALIQADRGSCHFLVVEHLEGTFGCRGHLATDGVVHRISNRVGLAGILHPLGVEGVVGVQSYGIVRTVRIVIRTVAVSRGIPDSGVDIAIAVDTRGKRRDLPRCPCQLGDVLRNRCTGRQVAAILVVFQRVGGIGYRDLHVGGQVQPGLCVLKISEEVIVAVGPDGQADIDPVIGVEGAAVVPVGITGIHDVSIDDIIVGLGDQIRIFQLDHTVHLLGAGDKGGCLRIPIQNRGAHVLHLGCSVVQEVDTAAHIGSAEGVGMPILGSQYATFRHVLLMLVHAVFDLLQIATAGECRRANRCKGLGQDNAVVISRIIADGGLGEGLLAYGG